MPWSVHAAVHEKGLPSATLGQVKNRADVVVFWGSNPVHAHPRHMGDIAVFAKGFFNEKGGAGARSLSWMSGRPRQPQWRMNTYRWSRAVTTLLFQPFGRYLRGQAAVVPDSVGGVAKEQLVKLVDTLKAAKFGAVFSAWGLPRAYQDTRISIMPSPS